ncbi:MAG: hypothetical protein ABIK92_09115 [Pseudomonadota bacterium]
MERSKGSSRLSAKPIKAERAEFKLRLNVSVPQLDMEDMPNIMVYAFDSKNRLVDVKPVRDKKGERVEFNIKNQRINDKVRVIVGPQLDISEMDDKLCIAKKLPNGSKPKPSITPKRLLSKGGIEAKVRLNQASIDKDIILQKEVVAKWIFCRCTVKGRLVKEMELPDGTIKKMGVYQACIFIWEVDRWYLILQQLPERELLRIRDDLIRVIEKWPPEPWPPDPDPWQFVDTPRIQPKYNQPQEILRNKSSFSADMEISVRQKKRQELDSIFTAQSMVSLRREMLAKAELLIPYLCHFQWIYSYLHKDFLTCTCTDAEGYFERDIYYLCSGDKPDLYFTAYQCIDGNWVTLYDPGMRCHVYWNYACGTDVLLVTKEPGAKVSYDDNIDPPAGVYTWVEPHGIGGVNLFDINNADGTISYSYNGHQFQNAPFGTYLGFRMGRSNNIPNNDVYYYRIQYRKGTTGEWFESCEPVTRHYIHEENNKITYPTVSLGSFPVNGMHLYRFRPDTPYELDNSLDQTKDQWPDETWFGSDLYAGYLNTNGFPGGINTAHGLYQVKIEVYNSAGNIVKPYIANPKFEFIMPSTTDSTTEATETILAPSAYQDGDGFIFNLAIDNRSCSASIDIPVVGGVPQETFGCGFLYYDEGDNVKISFHATHPGNNALVSFTLQRGDTDPSGMGMSMSYEEVSSVLYSGGYTNLNDGDFEQTISVGTLLGPCTNAAFAEHLYVYAKAFNGWHRIAYYDGRYYDASAMNAFALALDDSEE